MNAEKVLEDFHRHITDCVFLYIEHNPVLKKEYEAMDAAAQNTFNCTLGRQVRKFYHLDNDGTNASPHSNLIEKYTIHK